jgi:hypothetical protein
VAINLLPLGVLGAWREVVGKDPTPKQAESLLAHVRRLSASDVEACIAEAPNSTRDGRTPGHAPESGKRTRSGAHVLWYLATQC